jgi:hypothetical protein
LKFVSLYVPGEDDHFGFLIQENGWVVGLGGSGLDLFGQGEASLVVGDIVVALLDESVDWNSQINLFLCLKQKKTMNKLALKINFRKMNQLLSELSPAKYRKRSTNMLRVGELSVLGTVRAVQAHLLAGYRRSS